MSKSGRVTKYLAQLFVSINLDMNNKRITNLGTPVSAFNAATKEYVDSHINSTIGSYVVNLSTGNLSTVSLSSGNLNSTNISTGILRANTIYGLQPTVIIEDQKPSGTNGGNAVIGYQVRDLNTITYNNITGVGLNSNIITCPSGTYKFNAFCPGYSVDNHRIRLYNITDSIGSLIGTSEYAKNSQTTAHLEGILTLNSEKLFRIEQYCNTQHASTGLGFAVSNGEVEVYSKVIILKYI